MSRIPIALQMYTLRHEAQKDFAGTLRQVAEIGYAGVELAGCGSLTARELKTMLDDLGLKVAGSHVGFGRLEANVAEEIDFNLEIGSPYIVCPSIPEAKRTDEQTLRSTAEQLNRFGAICQEHGLGFCYHNHSFEFTTKFGGRILLDLLYEITDPQLVQAEIDVYWAQYAGYDPAALIRRHAGRCPLIHLKDMAGDAERSFVEVGEGILNFDAIFTASEAAGVQWYIVEQDACQRPPLDSIRISLDNLKARGKV
ncbi:MAG TPA: sugar phosphate isomerase/epimerase [Anaerolineae bacterium]|nr:sugar phosphate isomerase/epimerase [Anaerolineae bacterium]